jgi:hypothetical protein|tara:strand:- start:178 stop:372 length:195 start_codon:yes stop_codon:yes gene_type:complete
MEIAQRNYATALHAKQQLEERLEDAIEVAKKALARVHELCEHDFECFRLYDHKSYSCRKCGFER